MSETMPEPAATEPPAPAAQGDGTPGPNPRSASDALAPSGATAGPATRPPNRVRMTWAGEHRFAVGRPDGPTVPVDADGRTAPGPVDLLLGSLASCVSTDVVDILVKRRTPVESLTVDVTGTRRDAVPRRLTHVHLGVRLRGAGIERVHAERAVELAVTKYCSVRDSLDRDIPIEWTIDLGDGA